MVWAPTEHTDAAFRSLVELYERLHETVSGIDWTDETEARVDARALAPFAQGVVDEWDAVGSTAFHVLVDGFLAALQVICERCGVELEVSDSAYALAAAMRHNM